MISKIVKRNSRVTEVTATACMLLSLPRREMIESAIIKRHDLDDQGTGG
mgnify:CR=1 FL=1